MLGLCCVVAGPVTGGELALTSQLEKPVLVLMSITGAGAELFTDKK